MISQTSSFKTWTDLGKTMGRYMRGEFGVILEIVFYQTELQELAQRSLTSLFFVAPTSDYRSSS